MILISIFNIMILSNPKYMIKGKDRTAIFRLCAQITGNKNDRSKGGSRADSGTGERIRCPLEAADCLAVSWQS